MGFVSQTTKRALEASLKKLLLQKPLNKITINDITEDCGVNRMTFYYHFKDIYDLVDWIMVEDAAKALEEKPTFDTWSEAYLDLLRQVQENKVLVMNVYRSMSREQVEQYLYRILDPMLREFLDRGMQGITVQDADKQFIVDFYNLPARPLQRRCRHRRHRDRAGLELAAQLDLQPPAPVPRSAERAARGLALRPVQR